MGAQGEQERGQTRFAKGRERRVNDDWNAACNQDEENWQPQTGTPSSVQVQNRAHSVHFQNGGTVFLGV